MSKHDWYRNTCWNSDIEAAFFAKLKRARDKSQYLRIQAAIVSKAHPEVALRLLDAYFELGNDFDYASAYGLRAEIYQRHGNVELAITNFEAALKREAVVDHVLDVVDLDDAGLPECRLVERHRAAQVRGVRSGRFLSLLGVADFPHENRLFRGERAVADPD